MSLVETKCPMCKGVLWIDPSTLKIIDHRPADRQKASLEQFLKDSKQDKGWDEKMKKVQAEEARRKAEIEEKFRQAKTTMKDVPPEERQANINWD